LHLGILCDYDQPLRPQSGIGVFVFNLVEGLLAADPLLHITFLVSPAGQVDLQPLFQRWQPRIRIVAGRSPFFWTQRLKQLLQAVGVARVAGQRLSALGSRGRVSWGFRGTLARALGPVRGVLGGAKRFLRRLIERRVKPYGCDVWLVPFSGCKVRLTGPTVLVIHDVVWKHFPACLDRASRLTMESLVPRRAAEATLCACMSSFIRQTDLLGVLALPPEKVRLVLPAVPTDFPTLDPAATQRLRPPALDPPFILYPAAFRSYKNHRALVEALHLLQTQHGITDLDLVFTSENEPPAELRSVVAERRLEGRVHFLGCVDRSTLAALYRLAFATVLPSLYEQGSFPLYEALHAGCPVGCADIPALREQCAALGEAMLYFDPHDPGDLARMLLQLRSERAAVISRQQAASRPLWQRTWIDAARDWLALFQEAIALDRWQKHGVDRRLLEPWPRDVTPAIPRDSRRSVFLFLQIAYAGGVWEATKELVQELVAINRERGRLKLTLGIHDQQQDTRALEHLGEHLRLERLRLNPIDRADVQRMVGKTPEWLAQRPEHSFCFFSGAARVALEADAWLALVDRFPLPLLPARPYGVLVYDMIQRVVPEAFDAVFFQSMKMGTAPTIKAARLVLTTTPQTRADVLAEYGLDPAQVVLAPLACNPARRFGGLKAKAVPAARVPFLLNTSNLSRHKGIDVLLRGYARLRQHVKDCPQLVVCGVDTERFTTRAARANEPSECRKVWRLMAELGLREGRDVLFLGLVQDSELLDLYQRCEAVINAARYDNGSFLLVEGAHFGCRCVSSLYPAVDYLCRRYQIPVQFFPAGDSDALAQILSETLRKPLPCPTDVARVHEHLLDPELRARRYAERVYQALTSLADGGAEQIPQTLSLKCA
jgi:glycosyltransferase involved in cell wall biosynthesis